MSTGTETTDLPFDFNTPGFLTMGHPSHGDITGQGGFEEGSDIDLFKVPVVPGGTYNFFIAAYTFSDGSTGNADPFIEVWYADGPYWTDGGTDDFITLTIPEDYDADHVFCSAEGFLPANTGGYEIKVERTDAEDDHGADFDDAPALSLNAAAQGVIDFFGDSDAFILDLLAGKRIVVFVTGNPLDPLDVMIQDGDYNTVTVVPYTDESFAFTTGVSGNFIATGSYSDGSQHDVTPYTVWATETVTDLNLILGDSSDETQTGTAAGDEMYLGDGDDDGLGNGGPDWIFGMGGADRINGGPGADHGEGGTQNDVYVCNSVNDVCVEYAGGGNKDTVQTTVSRQLEAYIENLVLKGAADINGTGNNLPNQITGNKGDNVISGGKGSDTEKGGEGADTFSYAESGAANADFIIDFDPTVDRIRLDHTVFTKLGPVGALAPAKFYAAPGANAAHDATDRVILNTTNGACMYDPDGTGPAAAKSLFTFEVMPLGGVFVESFEVG